MAEPGKDAAWLALMLERARDASDEDERFELLAQATDAGSATVRAAVVRLLGSGDAEDQRLGADLAGRMATSTDEERAWARGLGSPLWEGERFEPDDEAAVAQALGTAIETASEPCVIDAAIVAAGHQGMDELIPVVLPHAAHADAATRPRPVPRTRPIATTPTRTSPARRATRSACSATPRCSRTRSRTTMPSAVCTSRSPATSAIRSCTARCSRCASRSG